MAGVPMPPGGMPSPYLDVQWTSSPTTNFEINSVDAMQRQMEQVQFMGTPKDTFGPAGAEKHGKAPEGQNPEAPPTKKKIHDNDWWNGVKNTLLGGLLGVVGGGFMLHHFNKKARVIYRAGEEVPKFIDFMARHAGKVGAAVGIGVGILTSIFGI